MQRTTYIHDEQDIEDAIMQLRKSQATMATIEEGAIEGDYLICTLQKLMNLVFLSSGKNLRNNI